MKREMNNEMKVVWENSKRLSAKYGLGCMPKFHNGVDGIYFRLESRPHKEMWLSVEEILLLDLNDELKKFRKD